MYLVLCHTLTCFHMVSISLISGEDHHCAYHFLWRLPLYPLLLCFMTHYDITIGNDIARDAHCNIAKGNDIDRDIHCCITIYNVIAMCRYDGITMYNDVAMNLFYHVLLQLIMRVFSPVISLHINH